MFKTIFISSLIFLISSQLSCAETKAILFKNKPARIVYNQNIPKEYRKALKIYLPGPESISLKPEVLIKGQSKYLMPVFVNGKEIELREDGRFYYKHALDKQKNVILISFTTPQFKSIHIIRKVFYLKPIKEQEKLVWQLPSESKYFFNSMFVNKKIRQKALSDVFSRADLTFFIARLLEIEGKKVGFPVFKDVQPDYWAAPYIQYAVDKSIMSEYPDGNFYPKKKVSNIEYIITMARALDYQLPSENIELPYKDINKKHWSAKYIYAAYQNKILPSNNYLYPKRKLTIKDYVLLALEVDKVKTEIAKLKNYEDGYQLKADE
ncbi:S-layer homology domain-containing protein, partial [Candidatus Margulisiibacteriota bacterium]